VEAIIVLSTVTVDINLLPPGFGRDVTWKNAVSKQCNFSPYPQNFPSTYTGETRGDVKGGKQC